MKKIEAVIRPEKLDILKARLDEIGYPGMMMTEIRGHGKQGGVTHQFRGTEYKTPFLPKIKIEIVVPDSQVKKLIDGISEVCRSGAVGDRGKSLSQPSITRSVSRTGESGDIAVS